MSRLQVIYQTYIVTHLSTFLQVHGYLSEPPSPEMTVHCSTGKATCLAFLRWPKQHASTDLPTLKKERKSTPPPTAAATASSILYSDPSTSEIPNNSFVVLSEEVDECFGHKEISLHLTGLPVASHTRTHTHAHARTRARAHTHTHTHMKTRCM